MTRNDIISAISTHLSYDTDLRDRTMSLISGTLAELDALPPYPSDTPFQAQLSTVVYPFLAVCQALEMEGLPTEIIEELVVEMFPSDQPFLSEVEG